MRKPRPLADLLDTCLGPSLAAQGFAASDILVAWPEIVGARLSEFTQPVKVQWKRRSPGDAPEKRPEPATLIVRVESAFALEMQHLAPIVIERVNSHYGWRCVGRIVLKQGPVRRAEPPRRVVPQVTPEDAKAIEAALEPIVEEPLRNALARLGMAVVGTSTKGERTKP
jgi:hypothetical protein